MQPKKEFWALKRCFCWKNVIFWAEIDLKRLNAVLVCLKISLGSSTSL